VKHANSILECFEYFCQISSKLIVTILSYTVSKLVHFLRHSVDEVYNGTARVHIVLLIIIRQISQFTESYYHLGINQTSAECNKWTNTEQKYRIHARYLK